MSNPYARAPHIEGQSTSVHPSAAPNAALLVDFDNVTMGMRSDLSKELKSLLNSDIIKGKVTVQRAYADWRRYPQYIVPLSEASIDLIFAPAYGSSKKNATDIRMAIDGMELVFTRPEIGTYILLTGDSDFSSLVLKLKEYGKYVIGVGIQESSSDILVQNCDEYYSYTSISGLRKTSDGTAAGSQDPWVLAERAVEQMVKRKDVMRSDRLKQVMLELDPGFDEKSFGFSKFSRFLTEAAQKGVVSLKKMENGQYEISPTGGPSQQTKEPARGRGRREDGRKGQSRGNGRQETRPAPSREPAGPSGPPAATSADSEDPLQAAYELLKRAIRDLLDDHGSNSVRDSDVKRRMLALKSGFDEAELGFSKFSRFLRQAHDHEIVELTKGENGQYHVKLSDGRSAPSAPAAKESSPPARSAERKPAKKSLPETPSREPAETGETADRSSSRSLRPRLSSRRRGADDEGPPPLLEGQVVGPPAADSAATASGSKEQPRTEARTPSPSGASAGAQAPLDPAELRLPTGRDSVIKYLSNSYRGVGLKTAETLVDELGEDLFRVLQTNPSRVEDVLPPSRAERVLEGWKEDLERRRSRLRGGGDRRSEDGSHGVEDKQSQRRGRRTRGGGRSSR